MKIVGMILMLAVTWGAELPGQNRRLIGTLREDLKVQQGKYAQAQLHEQRILEMRIRHDMGLPIRAGRYLEMTEEETNLLRFAEPGMLSKEEWETRQLARQLAQLQDRLEAATSGMPMQPMALVALPNMTAVTRPSMQRLAEMDRVTHPAQPAARPLAETRRLELADVSAKPDGDISLIRGSHDASNIGRVLLRSGEAMLRKSRESADEGLGDESQQWLERANRELQRAKKELDSLVWEQGRGKLSRQVRSGANLHDMFLLAQCEEKLENYGMAEELYLQVQGMDLVVDAEGISHEGQWALAADAANRVMKFMLDRGNWTPIPSIGSLAWPKK